MTSAKGGRSDWAAVKAAKQRVRQRLIILWQCRLDAIGLPWFEIPGSNGGHLRTRTIPTLDIFPRSGRWELRIDISPQNWRKDMLAVNPEIRTISTGQGVESMIQTLEAYRLFDMLADQISSAQQQQPQQANASQRK
jgi:hypothetical protein